MQVTAFNTSKDGAWQWRIVNYAGDTIAESSDGFPSISAALARGNQALAAMNIIDDSKPMNWRRSTSYLRGPR